MVDAGGSCAELLAVATTSLRNADVPEPRREVLRLWSDLRGISVAAAMTSMAEPVDASMAARFLDAVRRRIEGEPAAYVTGSIGFRRLTLHCDRRALIPRPETEGLVEAVLARIRHGVIADIGTGTGAIALALRDEGAFAEVIGVDLSPDALALARSNGEATGRAVTWLEGDLVGPLAGRQLDLLVSNPPYISRLEYDTLDRSVRDYEPAMALVGGNDGQQMIRRLFHEAPDVVAPGGSIALEVDSRRAQESARIATAAGWQDVNVLDDLFGRARYLFARRGSGS